MYTKEKHLAIKNALAKGILEMARRGWFEDVDSIFDTDCIKSKPKYRPFRSWTELRREMQRHSPYGVVVAKDAKKARFKIIDEVFAVYKSKTYEEAFELLEFADGTPFGIKEE